MISRSDCILLLTDLQKSGTNINPMMQRLLSEQEVPLEVIEFINSKRTLSLRAFYEKLRKSYNNKKSRLYVNIVKYENKPDEVLTTLSSLLLQTLLFSKTVDDPQMFLRHCRFDEITSCLYNYSQTYDLTDCLKLLSIIKCDLKCLEQISNRKGE